MCQSFQHRVIMEFTITLDFSMITDEMKRILQLLSVNLEKISNISKTHSFTIIRANQSIEHIFFGIV